MGFQQDPFIIGQPSQQLIGAGTGVDLLPVREALGVLLQLGSAEEF